MRVVAEHLADQALARSDADADLFARTAFNRYYYSTFLISRDLVHTTVGTKGLNHSDYPNHLKGEFFRHFKRQIKAAERANLVSAADCARYQALLLTMINELATVLVEAYRVRIEADYEPENLIQFGGSIFSLGTCTNTQAGAWVRTASRCHSKIKSLWSDLGN